jgi:hypothetical protein
VRSNSPWLDPKYLAVGMQAVRAIGWRRVVPLVAVGVLVAGLAKEWGGRDQAVGEGDKESSEEREAA